MFTLQQTANNSKPPYIPLAYYAALDDVPGYALRTADGHVHFQTESTGLWQELGNADAYRLMLFGRLDLVEESRRYDALHSAIYNPSTRAYPRLAA